MYRCLNQPTKTHLLIVPQESEVRFSEGERHAGDSLREVEALCSLPPVLGLDHSLTATQRGHVSVQHAQVQFPTPHSGNLFCHPKGLMHLRDRKGG